MSNNYAWTLMESGRLDEAMAEAIRGLNNDVDNVRLRTTLATIHYRRGDGTQALHHFERALGTTAAHYNLAILDIDSGNFDSARNHLQLANHDPNLIASSNKLLAALDTSINDR
ncbi:MAG: tetratricopeptide repeat protein [Pirellulaceae bacterium]